MADLDYQIEVLSSKSIRVKVGFTQSGNFIQGVKEEGRYRLNLSRAIKSLLNQNLIQSYPFYYNVIQAPSDEFTVTSINPIAGEQEELSAIEVQFNEDIDFATFNKTNILFNSIGSIIINNINDGDLTITWNSEDVLNVNIYLYISGAWTLIETNYPNTNTYTFTRYGNYPNSRVRLVDTAQPEIVSDSNTFNYLRNIVAPTINKVDATIVMTGDGSIRYTYNLLSEPADPTETDTLYTIPLVYVDGFYKAKSFANNVSSSVASEQFISEVVSDYIAYFQFEDNFNDKAGNFTITNNGGIFEDR